MKGIESGKDKVKKICDVLRKETLEPAKVEAEQILEKAHRQAEEIVMQAHKTVEKMQIDAKQQIDRQRIIFESSIAQGCQQALEALRQEIEEKLFSQELKTLLTKEMQSPKVIAELISAVIRALDKEGTDADLSVYVSAAVPARSVTTLLTQEILEKLSEKSILVGPIEGGMQVKVHKGNFVLDFSVEALQQLVARYVRKDFRRILFGKT